MTRNLLFLNGLAVIGAVLNHAAGWGFTSLFWWTDRYAPVSVPDFSQLGTPTYYWLRAIEQVVTAGVPVFLFVSGYFVAFAAGRAVPRLGWDKVGSRLRLLLVPYLLWSVAIFVARFFDGAADSSSGYLRQLLFGQAAEPYYYIPLITQLYLLAPFIVMAIHRFPKTTLAAAAAVQVATLLVRYPLLLGWDAPMPGGSWVRIPGWFFPHAVFWFVFGVYAGFHLGALKSRLARWRPVLPWITVGLAALAMVEWEWLFGASGRQWLNPTPTLLDSFYCFGIVLTFLAYAASMTAPRQLDALGARSFGVYLIHAPVLELASRAAYHGAPLLLGHQFAFVLLLITAGVGVPLLLMTIVNRTPARPYYNYLFG